MKKIMFVIYFIIFNISSFCQVNPLDIYSPITTNKQREEFKQNQINFINQTFSNLSDSVDYQKLTSAFWAMELINYKNSEIENKLKGLLLKYNSYPLEFKRSLLQVIYSSFKNSFKAELEQIMLNENNDKLFAMCANYLINLGYDKSKIVKVMNKNFSNSENSPILFMLKYYLTNAKDNKPNIKDLVKHNIIKNYPIIFSFQRKNRDYQGIAVIRQIDGKLLKDNTGRIFYIKQLARAVTNLPGYITNGNTPQGIFTFINFGEATNKFIGPTPTVQLALPYEVSPSEYFKDSTLINKQWDLELYKNMLPVSWQNYTPIYEAYYAGKAGRNEIIAHGTTVDPEYYKGAPFYPNTPTYGCLCAYEVWNPNTGGLIQSDQVDFVNAIIEYGFSKAFLIVVELDDQQNDVTIEEVLKLFE